MDKETLKRAIQDNLYYTGKEKNLYLAQIDNFTDEEAELLLKHLERNNHRVDRIPPSNEEDQKALLTIIGKLNSPEQIKEFADIAEIPDQSINDQQWTAYREEIENDPDKMAKFVAGMGPDGIENIIEMLFQSYQNKEANMHFPELLEVTSSLSALKQMLNKINHRYVEKLQAIFVQETERKQINQKSQLDRAQELINNLLN